MKTVFYNKRISGILTVLPETVARFEDEIENYTFTREQSLRLQKVMGYKQHRIAKASTATSDMCVFGLEHALAKGWIKREDIGAVIAVTLVPDHFVPHVSNAIQGRCSLGTNVLCMDIQQGCAGFILGLMQAFLLLEHMPDKKILLFNTDVLSHKTSPRDRNSYPLIGDAAALTVIESGDDTAWLNLYMDGTRRNVVGIPAGGTRLPCGPDTGILRQDEEGNLRALEHVVMNGSGVFQFVQTEVPPMIEETLAYAGVQKDDIDWYLFHQPNRFMLKKLAQKLGVPLEKVPMNVEEEYGNPSGASIPAAITLNLSACMQEGKQRCCLSGFGSGVAWGAMVTELGDLHFCDTLISEL